jgi:hypothetical protein
MLNTLDKFIDSLFTEGELLQNFHESFKTFFWIQFDERTLDANSVFISKTKVLAVPSSVVLLFEDQTSLVIVAFRESVSQASLSDFVLAWKQSNAYFKEVEFVVFKLA